MSYFVKHIQDKKFEMKYHGLGPLGAKAIALPLRVCTDFSYLSVLGIEKPNKRRFIDLKVFFWRISVLSAYKCVFWKKKYIHLTSANFWHTQKCNNRYVVCNCWRQNKSEFGRFLTYKNHLLSYVYKYCYTRYSFKAKL